MTQNVALPQPPIQYSQSYERARNMRLEQVIQNRLARQEIPVYPGIPYFVLSSDVIPYSIPVGNTPVNLPFNVVVHNNPDMLTNNQIIPKYDMAVMLFFRIKHLETTGNAVTFTVSAFLDNVFVDSANYAITLNDRSALTGTYLFNIPGGEHFELRMHHDDNQPVDLDMPASRAWMVQISPNPRFIEK